MPPVAANMRDAIVNHLSGRRKRKGMGKHAKSSWDKKGDRWPARAAVIAIEEKTNPKG